MRGEMDRREAPRTSGGQIGERGSRVLYERGREAGQDLADRAVAGGRSTARM